MSDPNVKKTIQINPDLFSVSSSDKNKRRNGGSSNKTQKRTRPVQRSNNPLKKELMNKIKHHASKNNKTLKENKEFATTFEDHLNYLSELSKKRKLKVHSELPNDLMKNSTHSPSLHTESHSVPPPPASRPAPPPAPLIPASPPAPPPPLTSAPAPAPVSVPTPPVNISLPPTPESAPPPSSVQTPLSEAPPVNVPILQELPFINNNNEQAAPIVNTAPSVNISTEPFVSIQEGSVAPIAKSHHDDKISDHKNKNSENYDPLS